MQNQTNVKYSSNSKVIFKSARKILEKLNPKEISPKTTIFEGQSKIINRNKTSNKQYNFCKDMISLEVCDM